MKHVSLISGLIVTVIAFLISQWLDRYRLVMGTVAGIVLLIIYRLWKNRTQQSKRVRRIGQDEHFGHLLFRGMLGGIGTVAYFSLFFWIMSMTPVYSIFFPCEKLMERVTMITETKAWTIALKEIDKNLGNRHLPFECRRQLAEKKVNVLLGWADESKNREKIEKLTEAFRIAQEFDLNLLLELAEAKKHAAELENSPKKLQPGSRGVIHQIETSLYPFVVAYLSVQDSGGYPISDLLVKDLEVRENGRVVADFQLSNFRSVPEPLNVALCFDKSGSMKETLFNAKEAARSLINSLSSDDLAELVVFGEHVERILGWSNDRGNLLSLIEGTNAVGNTALYDALFLALDDLKTQNGKKAVVLLTDGKDTSSRWSLKETLEKAKRMGIPVFVIGVKSSELDRQTLKTIATESGGIYLEANNSSAELTRLYKGIAGTLKNLYRLVYQSENPAGNENTLTIAIGAENPIRIQRMYSVIR